MGSRQGSSLMMALFAITILSMMAILMVSRGTAGMKDTIAFRDHQSSFQAAEAGVEHARKLLNDGAPDNWDAELTTQYGADRIIGTADDAYFICTCPSDSICASSSGVCANAPTIVGTQTYYVRIEDNKVPDPAQAIVDDDNRIWIVSTGTVGGKTTTIRELVGNNAQDSHISQEHNGEHSLGWATTE
jgi:hypothetical protein